MFLVRRVCRIYLPYLAALALAVGLNATVSTGHIAGMNTWFNATWFVPVNWAEALKHATLIGNFNTDLFLMPSWTLVHEMRMSILFPVLVAIVSRSGRRLPAVLAAASGTGIVLDTRFGGYGNYFITIHYAAFFMAGAWLARHRDWSMGLYHRLRPAQRVAFIGGGLTLYVFGRLASVLTGLPVAVADVPIGAGAAMIVLWALSDPALLRFAAVRWLGKVSYESVPTALLGFPGRHSSPARPGAFWAILLLAASLSFAAATVFWWVIEAPAIRLGQYPDTAGDPQPTPVRVRAAAPLAPPRESSW